MLLPEAIGLLKGLPLIPIAPKGKTPLIKEWQNGVSDKRLASIANWKPDANVGVIASHCPAVDIDVTVDECAEAIQLAAELELGWAPVRFGSPPKRLMMYRTDEPFRKVKVFLQAPDGSTTNEEGKDYAVEILGEGQYYVVEGVHPSGRTFDWDCDRWWQQDLTQIDADRVRSFIEALPSYLPEGWAVREGGGQVRVANEDSDLLALAQQPLEDWDSGRIVSDIAPYLDLECHYDDWLKVGQALHHQFDGSDLGFDLWVEIFSDSSKFTGPEYSRDRWESFGAYHGRSVTLATLILETRAARDADRANKSAATVGSLMQRVQAANDAAELEVEISRDARKVKMLEVDRESLVVAMRDKIRELGGSVPVGVIRGWLKPARVIRELGAGAEDAPDWAKEWVFCTNGDKFFSLENKQLVTPFGFRARYNRLMPVDIETGERGRADVACLEQWEMQVVDNLAYVPWAGGVFEMNGCRWGNLYRDDLVPEAESWQESKVIERILEHAGMMFPDERERELFLSWCAWQVQQPGRKVRWAPYLFGVEGDGKSFWAGMVGAAMGIVNVRSLTAKVLESAFTDWATGAAVIVLEEMKQHGHNRYDVMNALKPLITNDVVEIHPKGRAPYMAPNTSNYLLLSNYIDGAPVTDGDRRYMFLRSALTVAEVRELDRCGHYDRLFRGVADNPGVVRGWLLGYSLHPEFSGNGRAPDTRVRSTVIDAVKSDIDLAVEDVIEDMGDTLIFSDLVTRLKLAGQVVVSDKAVAAALGRQGFTFLTRIRREGERVRIWSKTLKSAEQASEWLSQENAYCPDVLL